MPRLTETLARRAVERSVAERQSEYVEEMQRIVEATYELIERTGSLDPTLRDILAHAGLSTQGFYRYFRSKDELMLVLLDDGRRRLVDYLNHRMEAASTPPAKVRAWIEGVLAQASHPDAAARTRPFVANEDRLAEMFPEEQQVSVDLLVSLLADALGAADPPRRKSDVRRDAESVYRLVFATLRSHLIQGTRPSASTIDHVVRFGLRGAGVDEEGT
jgi:AcrR family transcriptional regulator